MPDFVNEAIEVMDYYRVTLSDNDIFYLYTLYMAGDDKLDDKIKVAQAVNTIGKNIDLLKTDRSLLENVIQSIKLYIEQMHSKKIQLVMFAVYGNDKPKVTVKYMIYKK